MGLDFAYRLASGRDRGDLFVAIDTIEYAVGAEPVRRDMSSWYTSGRVRPDGSGWIAAQGFGGSMRELGRYATAAEAEGAVRAGLATARAELAGQLGAAGEPLALLAPLVERLADRVEVWATAGARLVEAAALKGRDPVTIDAIARRLQVQDDTVRQWRKRGLLPDPDAVVYGRPVWWWQTIRGWAEETGRAKPWPRPKTIPTRHEEETIVESKPGGPTEKQVAFALGLLDRAGYRTDYMSSGHKDLATLRERHGTVEEWLRRMSRHEISKLIDQLQAKAAR